MKINAEIKVSINSGAALIIFACAFFLLLGFVALFPPVEKNFVAALSGLTGAFAGYLVKRNSNNKIDLETQKINCAGAAK